MVEHLVLSYCATNGISSDEQPTQEQQPAAKDSK